MYVDCIVGYVYADVYDCILTYTHTVCMFL